MKLATFARLLVGIGIVMILVPIGAFGYGYWEEQAITQQWVAHLPPPALPATSVNPADRLASDTPAASPGVSAQPAPAAPWMDWSGVRFLIKIPSLGYTAAVREGTSLDVLAVGPGHYRGTPDPGRAGNVGVAAHNTFWIGFGQLRAGDVIELQTRTTTYRYVVTTTHIVSPQDRAELLQKGPPRVTLTTCWPLWAGALASQRLIISAALVS